MPQEISSSELFTPEGRPPVKQVAPLALQHVLASIVGIITPAIVVAGSCGLSEADATLLIQASIFMSGIATLLQVFPLFRGWFGCGIPVIIGASFAYVPTMVSVGIRFGMPALFGAMLVATLISLLFALFIKPIRKLFPPVVSGTVILCIGVSLFTVGVSYMAGGASSSNFGSAKSWIVAFLTMFSCIYFEAYAKGVAKLGGVLFGIIVGYIISLPLGLIDFSTIGNAAILTSPKLMPFGIDFVPSAIATLAIISIPVAVETCGDISATSLGTTNKDATSMQLRGGMIAKAFVDALGCLFGALPTSIYGQNVGLVSSNKVVNRRVFIGAGLIMVVAGISPKIAAILATIPKPVIGGATITLFGIITMTGVTILISGNGLTTRRATIAGLSVALGMGVSFVPGCLSGMNMPYWAEPILGCAVVLPTIGAVILNLVLPRETIIDKNSDQVGDAIPAPVNPESAN